MIIYPCYLAFCHLQNTLVDHSLTGENQYKHTANLASKTHFFTQSRWATIREFLIVRTIKQYLIVQFNKNTYVQLRLLRGCKTL